MEDLRKRLLKSTERISYLSQIRDGMDWGNLAGLQEKLDTVRNSFYDVSEEELR